MLHLKYILNNNTLRNISLLSGGNIIAQLIPIMFAPILSRIYSPNDYGTFSSYYVIFGLFSIIATGRYEYSLLHPKSDNDVLIIVKISLYFALFLGISVFITSITYSFFNKLQIYYFTTLPLSVAGTGLFQTCNSWLNRYAFYKHIIFGKLIQNISKTFFEIFFGVFGLNSGGLFIGHFIGVFFANIYFLLFTKLKINLISKFNTKIRMLELAKEYKDYPLYNLPFSFIDRLATSVPLLFISFSFNSQDIGHFGFTERIIYSPFSLISAPIAMVLLKEVSQLYREHKSIKVIMKQITKTLIYLSIVPFLILLIFSNTLFSQIFGIEWAASGKIASILSLSFMVKSIISPLSNIFIALNLPKKIAQWQTLYLLFHLLGVGFSLYYNTNQNIYMYTWIVVIVDLISYCVYYFMIHKAIQQYNATVNKINND